MPNSAVLRLAALLLLPPLVACDASEEPTRPDAGSAALAHSANHGPAKGRQLFRYYTFGNEPFWTDTLRLHEVVQAAVDPATALSVGLKVDIERLPPGLLASADLKSPATTVELLRRDAVVGVQAEVSGGRIRSLGITCAFCHSTVDDSFGPGIGRRLDGWPNRDLNVGAIVALSPVLPQEVKDILNSWGPGMYDAYFNLDGINDPTVIPPAYGLADVALETFTGEGPISYWNAYVAVTQMHGHGSFSDPRLGIEIVRSPDLVTPVLQVLKAYQHSLQAPAPPPGSFDAAKAAAGKLVFEEKAGCASCHIPPLFTDVNRGILHAPEETGMDPLLAQRATTGKYRTTPLRGVWQHPPYFHDGSAATLMDVVEHYDSYLSLGLTARDREALVEYLKSL